MYKYFVSYHATRNEDSNYSMVGPAVTVPVIGSIVIEMSIKLNSQNFSIFFPSMVDEIIKQNNIIFDVSIQWYQLIPDPE